MIKFKAGNLYGFGLSKRNLELLQKGMPICAEFEGIEFMIFYGKTEEEMRAQLAEFIGPQTVVHEKDKSTKP